jgi:hypothetical protein
MAYEDSRSASFTDALKHVIDDVRELFREELALARAEVREEISSFSTAAVQMSAGAAIAGYAALFLLMGIALGFADLVAWPAWAGYLAMGIVLALGAGIAIQLGRRRLRETPAVPQQTLETLKETKEWMRDRMSSASR